MIGDYNLFQQSPGGQIPNSPQRGNFDGAWGIAPGDQQPLTIVRLPIDTSRTSSEHSGNGKPEDWIYSSASYYESGDESLLTMDELMPF